MATDPVPDLAAYLERLAICLEAGDLSEAEAHRFAAAEADADLEVLGRRQAAWWRARLEAWRPIYPALARLRLELRAIAGQPWLADAAHAGWGDVAMFGAHPAAPLVRVECWGLVTCLALSPHNRNGRRVRLVSLGAALARIETTTGARFGVESSAAGFDHAVPVWQLGGQEGAP